MHDESSLLSQVFVALLATLAQGCVADTAPACTKVLVPAEGGLASLTIGDGCEPAEGSELAPAGEPVRAGVEGDLGHLRGLDEQSDQAIRTHYRGRDVVSYLVADHSLGEIWVNVVLPGNLDAPEYAPGASLDEPEGFAWIWLDLVDSSEHIAVNPSHLEVTGEAGHVRRFTLTTTNFTFVPTFDEAEADLGADEDIRIWFEVTTPTAG